MPGAAAARARSTSAWPAPPPITESVRTRRVIFRGTKDDVARHLALLHPLSADQVDAGFERYVEFTASAASSKRWRIVVVSPAWTPERVAETPSEEPGADSLRALNTMHVVTQPTGVAA